MCEMEKLFDRLLKADTSDEYGMPVLIDRSFLVMPFSSSNFDILSYISKGTTPRFHYILLYHKIIKMQMRLLGVDKNANEVYNINIKTHMRLKKGA